MADVAEALIGVFLLYGGDELALHFIRWLLPDELLHGNLKLDSTCVIVCDSNMFILF